MKKLIYKKMLDAGWARDDANELRMVIEEHLEDEGNKITSANVDPKEVNVKFSDGTKLTYKELKAYE